uniref:Spp2/MOS2 G-patch domain-containing protein n=2 Tax=Rhodosorus marinus TaxID=101924 RepID=A0A7S3ECR3_9RHOD|mmetsp:Transcript_26312/g.102770  ORF Transcript_26312/g.102770 Transcript_26312/m.102770 type:complete len:191 (+) Transcript_26312:239-811(+)
MKGFGFKVKGRKGQQTATKSKHKDGFDAEEEDDEREIPDGRRKYIATVGPEENEEAKKSEDTVEGSIIPVVVKDSGSSQIQRLMKKRQQLKDEGISMDEDAIFKRDVESLPETSADSYERLPIENFGKMLLKGMGWQEGTDKHVEVKQPKIRQPRLGLGATPLPPDEAKRKRKLDKIKLAKMAASADKKT